VPLKFEVFENGVEITNVSRILITKAKVVVPTRVAASERG